ncbi:nickel pincer cofactor biosynthesis protein LarB [Angustibacter luteus]|uniref:Nickel pincer cofactor biosynthesis protein LarB n=1 Tax=Angustibacter luteus TaxID=658456 RepID=A0ABW1JDR5_9ACTN
MPEHPPHEDAPTAGVGYVDVGFARLDVDRARRTGDPEVVFGQGKTPEQIVGALTTLHASHPERAILATRLDGEARDAIRLALPDADVDDVSRTAVLGPLPTPSGRVLVVAAGTSDAPVAAEAMITARVHGTSAERVDDVGVAGLHRLLAVRDRLDDADALIVVAGMEGALPSVVGGLTGVPLVAVPTSIGYGTGAGGLAALLAMLNSCAPGIAVVNVDNGYGAGVHAARIARRARPRDAV